MGYQSEHKGCFFIILGVVLLVEVCMYWGGKAHAKCERQRDAESAEREGRAHLG